MPTPVAVTPPEVVNGTLLQEAMIPAWLIKAIIALIALLLILWILWITCSSRRSSRLPRMLSKHRWHR